MKKLLTFLLLFVFGIAGACSQTDSKQSSTSSSDNMETTAEKGTLVELKTTLGDIVVELYNDTPLHRDNFLKLVKEGYYDEVLFHRVIDRFMVQGGDPKSKNASAGESLGAGDPGYTIGAEIVYPKHYHKYGALAAARTGDALNPERRSSGSQFYIVTGQKFSERQLESMQGNMLMKQRQAYFQNLASQYQDTIMSLQASGDQAALEDLRQKLIAETEEKVKGSEMSDEMKQTYIEKGGTPHLDGQYTVFGEVVKGMDTVEKIQKVETDSSDRPKEDVRIISAHILSE